MRNIFSPYYISEETRRQLFDQMTRLRKRVDELDPGGIGGGFNTDIKRIDKDIADLQGVIENLEIGGGDVDLTPINNKIDSIQGDITDLKRDKADLTPISQELASIKDDILLLQEQSGGGGNVDLEPINTQIQLIVDDIDMLEMAVADLEARINEGSGGGGEPFVIDKKPEFINLIPGDFDEDDTGFTSSGSVYKAQTLYNDMYGNGGIQYDESIYDKNIINKFWELPDSSNYPNHNRENGKVLFYNGSGGLSTKRYPDIVNYNRIDIDSPTLTFSMDGYPNGLTQEEMNLDIKIEIGWGYDNVETLTVNSLHFDREGLFTETFTLPGFDVEYGDTISDIRIIPPTISGSPDDKYFVLAGLSLIEGEHNGDYVASKIGFGPFFKNFL